MSKLFSSLKIRDLEIKNRIGMSPMCMYHSKDGFAEDFHLVHLGSRAMAGLGLIITEATAISPEGRITEGDLGIWDDNHVPKLKEITTYLRQYGCASAIQLAHAGRKASAKPPWKGRKQVTEIEGGWMTLSSSPIPFYDTDMPPKEMSLKDIDKCKEDFKKAAIRSVKAGFDIIEVHAAHGYLLNQFISPLINQRKDGYGGSFKNRIKLLVEICELIRSVIPDSMPLFVRISAHEWAENGHTINESIQLSKVLKKVGVDLIDCSSGGTVAHQEIKAEKNYQVPFAKEIKRDSNILTAAVGLITEPQQAEDILQYNQADLVLLGRELLRNPYFALHAKNELDGKADAIHEYERGF